MILNSTIKETGTDKRDTKISPGIKNGIKCRARAIEIEGQEMSKEEKLHKTSIKK